MGCFVLVDRPCVLTCLLEMNAVFFLQSSLFFNGTFINMTIQYIATTIILMELNFFGRTIIPGGSLITCEGGLRKQSLI